MRILVTGSRGFIGKNLVTRLEEKAGVVLMHFARGDSFEVLRELVADADAIVHLAGENRPLEEAAFARVNTELTTALCAFIRDTGRSIPLIFASSTQAELNNPYGRSKRAGELAVEALAASGNPVTVYRLPGVFGKWSRPNYNSVVATFCHNIARDMPIEINNPAAVVQLAYVDNVVEAFIADLDGAGMHLGLRQGRVVPEYAITLGDLAEQILRFRNCRENLVVEHVGTGLVRALYSTYVSYLEPKRFTYDVPRYADQRGAFVEMLKTKDSGQFSYFTSLPGVTRGSHYHHSKTEKFLVIKGSARFGFRHILTDERHEILTSGERPQIVETVPGWTHDITNIGNEEMVVMLWANENFDRDRPDTISCKV